MIDVICTKIWKDKLKDTEASVWSKKFMFHLGNAQRRCAVTGERKRPNAATLDAAKQVEEYIKAV